MPYRTAVVILNWNNRNFLLQFLPDVIKFTGDQAELIVVDNASTDDSVSVLENNFPGIRIIKNAENKGFAGGYNAALAVIDSEYIVLLNSDVSVTENWLNPLIQLMDEKKEAGACQPKILSYSNPDSFEYAGGAGGFIDKYGYPFCRGRIFNSLEKDNHQYDDSIRIFWASGACMIVRTSVFRKLNGFDSVFFAHMEEIDLCWRMHLNGYHVYYCALSKVYHVGGGTLPKSNSTKTYLNFRNNLLMIFKNSTPGEARKIFRMRLFLDLFASFKFLFSGTFADFKAVWSARRDFNKLKSQYPQSFPESVNINVDKAFPIYPGCILWDYYLCGRRKFSSLAWKIKGEKQ